MAVSEIVSIRTHLIADKSDRIVVTLSACASFRRDCETENFRTLHAKPRLNDNYCLAANDSQHVALLPAFLHNFLTNSEKILKIVPKNPCDGSSWKPATLVLLTQHSNIIFSFQKLLIEKSQQLVYNSLMVGLSADFCASNAIFAINWVIFFKKYISLRTTVVSCKMRTFALKFENLPKISRCRPQF